jgi:hypothetical protein
MRVRSRGEKMKRFLIPAIVCWSMASVRAQTFVCGVAKPGEIRLMNSSLYSATTAGFNLATAPEVGANSCSSDKPFFLSISLTEGNYRVTFVLGSSRESVTKV